MRLYELVDAYKASLDFEQLAVSSQVHYQQMIDCLYNCGVHSNFIEGLSISNIEAIVKNIALKCGNAKSVQVCKVMRKIWNWGFRHNFIKVNPWSKMGLKENAPRQTLWKPNDINLAVAWSSDKVERHTFLTFFHLLNLTGQRPIDILNLQYANFHRGLYAAVWELHITQQKTGKLLTLPVPHWLVSKCVNNGPNPAAYIFPREFALNYRNEFARLKKDVPALAHLQLRDLRRTVLTEMADGGATDAQIRAVGGHSGHSPLPNTVYVVRDAKQAADGLACRECYYDTRENNLAMG